MKNILLPCLLAAFTQAACAEGSVWDRPTPALAHPTEITVYRSLSCGCCEKWMAHMKQHGFTVKDAPTDDMSAVKQTLGVPQALQSCHTARVGGYLIEGHVPAGDVKKLLKTRPKAAGLAAPGMPADSPGMEASGETGDFRVLVFDKQGKADTFNAYSNH